MEAKRTKANIVFILLAVLCLGSMLFVFRFWHDRELLYPYSLTNFANRGDYAINPYTILDDLEQGKSDVFKPDDASTQVNSTHIYNSFSWDQSDYLKVADALHRSVWGESLDNWKIFGMVFHRKCQDNPVGFDSADITFYKSNIQGGYKVREIEIYPLGSGISWGGADNWSRPLFGWESINLHLLNVTADDALRIAEESGGRDFRVRYDNECTIMLVLKPNPGPDDDWLVYYEYHGSLKTFEININPFTGQH